ncbi:hypothetical protein SAMN02744784_04256 [Stenotrophomonas sp. CC120223-11]|nr:hypothetical protein N434_04899 [Rhizobium sp. UGM030330-04]SNY78131.1 hypothetical protein SAMN02744784_04256 [Stenotrophomonas sp. CC120223-11]
MYAKAPDWVLDEQLEARGLGDSAVNTGEGQERTEMEAAQAKDEQENQALIEAQGSDEAAARLDGVVTAKSNVQKQKLAQVHSRAEAFKSKQAAAKQEVERTDREKDKEREHKEVEKRALRAKVLDERERDEDQKAHDREELEHTALDALDSQLAQDMADQRAELEADDYSLSEDFKEPEFDSDEERQLWHDMRQQRLEIERDEDGIEHE